MLFRLILLLAIAAAVLLFTLENLTPTLSLVFLGMKTPALPLSWWILGAIAAGSLTTLVIRFLFGLSNFVAQRFMQSQFRRSMRQATAQTAAPSGTKSTTPRSSNPFTRPRTTRQDDEDEDAPWKDWSGYEEKRDRPPVNTPEPPINRDRPPSTVPTDDWENPLNEDWEASPTSAPAAPPPSSTPPKQTFEAAQEPKQVSRSGSVYSYSYREPDQSGAGKSEKVVDADYRVLVPPYRPLDEDSPPTEENADDWCEDDTNGPTSPPSSNPPTQP
jgi:hypothetical protein